MPNTLNPADRPSRTALIGQWVQLDPLDRAAHGDELYRQSHHPEVADLWDYMSGGPYADRGAFEPYLRSGMGDDPLFFAIRPRQDPRPQGIAAYMRIKPEMANIEIGHIWFGPELRRTTAATEAIFLLIDHAFGVLGYRRVEWKCDARNQASQEAAARYGFRFEGLFHQHMIIKGRNRDTAWFALLDHQWRDLRDAYLAWLDPDNFDSQGRQRTALGRPPERQDPNAFKGGRP